MPNYFTKADTTKAAPVKKGDIKLQHAVSRPSFTP